MLKTVRLSAKCYDKHFAIFAVFEYYFDRSVKTFYNRTSMQTEMPGSHWIHIHVTETFWDGGKDGKRKNQQFI